MQFVKQGFKYERGQISMPANLVIVGSFLLVSFTFENQSVTAQTNFDLNHATAADMEENIDASLKAFTSYVLKIKIPEVQKSDPALARSLQTYFTEILPGKDHLTRGEIDFEVMMSKLEDKVAKEHSSLANYPAVKLANLSFATSMKMDKERISKPAQ